jgi:uncharacterized membrane protein (UPF0127 family)
MIVRCCAAACLAFLILAGCQKSASSAPPAPMPKTNTAVPSLPGWPPTNAQPKLQTMKLFVGPEVITAELAMTQIQVGTGMMFRKEMSENEGMLFVFARPFRASFYMKNTILPLNVAYLDSEGTILELHELQALNETPVEAASDNVQFVLEMNKGWFTRHNIGLGSVITCERGKLRDAFRFGN